MKSKANKTNKVQRDRDANEAITILRPERQISNNIIRFDVSGKSDISVNPKLSEDESVAVILVENKNQTFRVKVDRNKKLFNPSESKLNDQDRDYGKNKFQYRNIDEISFNSYLRFLDTKNSSYLNIAQKGVV